MRQVIDSDFISMLESRDLQISRPMNGLFGGNRRSKVYGSSVDFADYREYFRGDDLRRIDWNLYARFEKLYLKLFIDERQLHHKIYIDASSSMNYGKVKKGDMALRLAAALGYLATQAMDRVSYYLLKGDSCIPLSVNIMGKDAFYMACEQLNNVTFSGECNIGAALCSTDGSSGGGMSVILSDFLNESEWKNGVDYLVFKKREVHLVQILSSEERDPHLAGKVLMIDSEAVDEEDDKNYRAELGRSAMKAYAQAYKEIMDDFSSYCGARGVGFLPVTSEEDPEKLLFNRATAEGGLIV